MTKFYTRIVKHCKRIIAVFLVLFVVCLACRQLVAVDYDMNDYLPQESPSTQALDRMEQEYSGGEDGPESFISEKNTNVSAVQFVIKTAAVEKAAASAAETTEEAPRNFWQKLLHLFGLA